MAERQVGVRLAVIDGGKVKAELRSVGQEGAAALEKIRAASSPASAGLEAVNNVASDMMGRMDGLSGNAGLAASALRAFGPAGLAAAAGLGAIILALGKGLNDFSEAEKVSRRLDAILQATGYSAGLTAEQLDEFADAMERGTMASAEGVKEAAGVLATFRSISGDTFTRALELAQDLAATFGTSLAGSATQLGKALEDPIEGISALRRVGVSFTASQKDLIRGFVEAGDAAAAQRLILDVLARQVGGAGSAEADTVAGAFKRAEDAIGNFLEQLVEVTGVAPAVRASLDNMLAPLFSWMSGGLKAPELSEQLAAAAERLATAQADLQQAEDIAQSAGTASARATADGLQKRVAKLQADLDKLNDEATAAQAKVDAAANGAASAAADARTEQALAKLSEYRKALEGLATPEEKITKLRDALASTVDQLNKLRNGDGSNAKTVDEAVATATELTRRSIAEIEKPGQEAATRASEQTRALIDDLTGSINMFGNSRAEFVQRYVDRLGDGASDDERRKVEALANALYDKGEAEKAGQKAVEGHRKAMEEGRHVLEEVRTAAEKYAARLSELDKLLQAGAITQETYGRAVAKARKELEDQSTSGIDGVRRALRKYGEEAQNSAKQIETVMTQSFKGIEDAIVEVVTTGKADWSGLIDSILADLVRLQVRTLITGPLSAALGGVTNSLLGGLTGGVSAGIFHSGDKVSGTPRVQREVPAALFAAAPRFHSGSSRLGADEIPAILQTGERVLNRAETLAYERGGQGRGMQVNFNVTTPNPESFRMSESQLTAMLARTVARGRRGL